jgi:hypothetical protein
MTISTGYRTRFGLGATAHAATRVSTFTSRNVGGAATDFRDRVVHHAWCNLPESRSMAVHARLPTQAE